MSERIVLALDLALATGWTVGPVRALMPIFGSFKLPGYDLGIGRNLASLENQFLKLVDLHHPTDVVIEAPFLTSSAQGKTSGHTMYCQIGLATTIEAACYRASIRPPSLRRPQDVRRRVLGSGQSSSGDPKGPVVAWCHRMGWLVQTTDEADAAILWRYETWLLSPQGTRAAA